MLFSHKLERTDRVAELLCLLAAAAAELLFFLLEDRAGGLAYVYVEQYLTVPAMLFLGFGLSRNLSRQGKQMILLGIGVLGWFFVSQTAHRLLEAGSGKIGAFFCAYALFLPFAAVTRDEKRQRGLLVFAALFMAVSVMLVCYAGLLCFGLLPEYLQKHVCWDSTRFSAMGHPNICATLLMIGMAFSSGAFLRIRNPWVRGVLLFLLAAQFAVISLTNGRTTIVFTCFLLGGIVFCALRKTGRKRLIAALLAGVVVMGGLIAVSGRLYSAHAARFTAAAQQTAEPEQPTAVKSQGSWEKDVRTLNGRTGIWASAVKGLRENQQVPLVGTEYVDVIVSRENPFPIAHTHNSWLEALYRMGLPGLALALVLTVMAVRDAAVLLWRNTDVWKSCVALLALCLLGCAMLEPYLFVVDVSYHFFDFLFLLCLGYMELWRKEAQPKPTEKAATLQSCRRFSQDR